MQLYSQVAGLHTNFNTYYLMLFLIHPGINIHCTSVHAKSIRVNPFTFIIMTTCDLRAKYLYFCYICSAT